jgi:hypothetical protein
VNPLTPIITSESLPMNWDLHTRYYYNFKKVYYNTDYGFAFEDINSTDTYVYSKRDISVQIRHGSALYPNVTFGTLTITRDPNSSIYQKSFDKVQSVLARIGGIINFLLLLGKFISYIITKNLFLMEIFNKELRYDEKKSPTEFINPITKANNFMNNSTLKPVIKLEQVVSKPNLTPKLLDIICPYFMRKNEIPAKMLKKCSQILDKNISIENIFNHQIQFELLKSIIFNEKQHEMFENLPAVRYDFFDKDLKRRNIIDLINNTIAEDSLNDIITMNLVRYFNHEI